VSHGKVDVEHSDELGVSLDDFPDTLSSESFLPESSLDLVQDLFMTGLGLVENCHQRQIAKSGMRSRTILESQVGGTQSVTEVLSKDPSDISVCGLLYGVGSVFALNDSELHVSERSL
jgi:hypothetical protein